MTTRPEFSEAFSEEIYLVLADYSWDVYKKSKFSNYFEWATYIHKCLKAGQLTPIKPYLLQMTFVSQRFFGFSEDELLQLTMEFFYLEKYREYYEHIRLFKSLYGGYIIKKAIKI